MTPIELVIVTVASLMVARYVLETLVTWYKLGFKTLVFRVAVKLPYIKGKVAAQLQQMEDDFRIKYIA